MQSKWARERTQNLNVSKIFLTAGELTLDEYLAQQSDAEAAKERFGKLDANKDGFVTREEFITAGGKNPNAK